MRPVCLLATVTLALSVAANARAADLDHAVPPPAVPAAAAFGLVPSLWYDGGAPYVAEGPVAGHPRPAIVVTKPQVVSVPRTNTAFPEQLYTVLTSPLLPRATVVTLPAGSITTPYGRRPLTRGAPMATCAALPDGRLFCN